jgi:preprotein translocase subunit SecE
VAESKRRGKDAIDEEPVDEDIELDDEIEDEFDEEIEDDDLDEPDRAERNGKAPAKAGKADLDKLDPKARTKVEGERVGIFGRVGRFVREVVAELRKVIWPTRKELLTYTSVVIVFVTIMLTLVATLDSAFAWGVLHVFGGGK